MKRKFRISVDNKAKDLHLKLFGDFDGSSAFELMNSIEHHRRGTNKIFVHTDSLNQVETFGRQVFGKFTNLRKDHLVFTGKHASFFKM